MISDDQQRNILRYGCMFLDFMESDYGDANDRRTYIDMLRFGAIPKEQLVDGHRYFGFYKVPGHYEPAEAIWVSAADAFVFRGEEGPDACIEALHYFHPYPDTDCLFIPFFNEPQGEPDEQLRRPPAEHTA